MKNKNLPSAKLVHWVRIFHFSLGFFLLLATLLLNGCNSNSVAAVPLNWKQADAIPTSLLQLAVSENTSLTPDSSSNILAASIPTTNDNQLYLFKYNSPATCGKFGCLYVAYLTQGKSSQERILSLYLEPDLPPKEPLFSVVPESSTSTLPCLEVRHVERNTLQKLTYCFDGHYYKPIQNVRVKLPQS